MKTRSRSLNNLTDQELQWAVTGKLHLKLLSSTTGNTFGNNSDTHLQPRYRPSTVKLDKSPTAVVRVRPKVHQRLSITPRAEKLLKQISIQDQCRAVLSLQPHLFLVSYYFKNCLDWCLFIPLFFVDLDDFLSRIHQTIYWSVFLVLVRHTITRLDKKHHFFLEYSFNIKLLLHFL